MQDQMLQIKPYISGSQPFRLQEPRQYSKAFLSKGWDTPNHVCRASFCYVFHISAVIGLMSAGLCPIQHVESALGPWVREITLIGCSVWQTYWAPAGNFLRPLVEKHFPYVSASVM